jgi:undecaprenyl-diphosphatase
MTWWQAIVLGLVEGITEYLPVSSTGHLILARTLIGLNDPAHESAVNAFVVVVQGGAILAVLGLYWPRVRQIANGLLGRDPGGRRLALNLLVAFLPAAIAGFLFDDLIERHLFGVVPVLVALVVGGIYMIALDRAGVTRHGGTRQGGVHDLTPAQAFVIGVLQCVAMWPGTSRSMMTITGGCLVGLAPAASAEVSFLLGVPTLGAATAYTLLKNLKTAHETGGPTLFGELGTTAVVLGLVVATVSAAAAVRWLVAFLNRHGLTAFGVYRIVLGLALGALLAAGVFGL